MPFKFLFSHKVLENSPWYLAFRLNIIQITLTCQLFLLLPSTWLQLNPRLLWEPSMPAQIQRNTHLHLHKHQKTTLKRSTDKKQFVTLVGSPESSFCLREKKKNPFRQLPLSAVCCTSPFAVLRLNPLTSANNGGKHRNLSSCLFYRHSHTHTHTCTQTHSVYTLNLEL